MRTSYVRAVDLSGLTRPAQIRVVKTPPGTAPEEVRQAFVGESFPMLTTPAFAMDELGDPRAFAQEGGCCRIDAYEAVSRVGAKHPAVLAFFAPRMQQHQSAAFMLPGECIRFA